MRIGLWIAGSRGYLRYDIALVWTAGRRKADRTDRTEELYLSPVYHNPAAGSIRTYAELRCLTSRVDNRTDLAYT
jgi:hypothetical protein